MPPGSLPAHEPDVANGERMFNAVGCASCHASSDSESDLPLLGGGLAMETAFGVFHVPNISPDALHGIGQWAVLDFVNAMKKGVSPRGRHYYPAFPYTSYARMEIEDLMDLKSYLDTLPADQTPNLEHEMKFPWNIRFGIGFWKLINLDSKAVVTGLPRDQLT